MLLGETMITKVKDISEDDFEKRLQITCVYDDGERNVINNYIVEEATVVKKGKESRECVVECISSPARNVVFKSTGEVNDYIKNDIADCIRVFNCIVINSKWVEP